jgi:hypothetical protein
MTTAVHERAGVDLTDVGHIMRSALVVGITQTVLITAIAFATRALGGAAEALVVGVLVLVAILVTAFIPGLRTRARTIEGIAGAAGIGLGATVVFLILDVALLQPLGVWTNRWHAIGGGSNWWYHPVFWMVGTYLAWMGAWILANQARRDGEPGLGAAAVVALVATLVAGAVAVFIRFPGAGWNVPTFGVAALAGFPLAVLLTSRVRRSA